MAITQCFTTSAKAEVLGAIHDFDTDTFKIALYTSSATLDATTTAYAATNEVSGVGYSAGGIALTGAVITTSGTTAYVDFADAVWPTATITARGALIYNASKSNKAVFILDFGADKTSTGADFSVIMPVPAAATAVVRVV